MTVNPLPPVPDSNSWIINGQPSQALVEYMNAIQRQGNEIRSALTALEEQDGALAAGIDSINVTQAFVPGWNPIETRSAAVAAIQEFTNIPEGISAIELQYRLLSPSAVGNILFGIDDDNGASYTSSVILTAVPGSSLVSVRS